VNAETIQARMRFIALRLLAACVCAAVAFVSGSPATSRQKRVHAGESTVKKQIPPADPNKYRAVQDARDWQNPYLIVQANGIDVRPIGVVTQSPTMSPVHFVTYLEKLPSTAWPYGLVVAVVENGLRRTGDDARITRNREELVCLLEKNRGKSGSVAFSVEIEDSSRKAIL